MKKKWVYVLCGALFALAGCTSEPTEFTGECVAVTYLRGICNQAVLQIQDPQYFEKGENVDGETNVFLATFECDANLPPLEPADGNRVFFVELNPPDFRSDCAVCLAAPPFSGTKVYPVRVHATCSRGAE